MSGRTLLLALALVTVPLAGCATPPTDGSAPEGPIGFETIDQGPNSGIEERGTVVVRDQAAWRTLWDEHTSDRSDPPKRPAVDFNESMVLAAFKGESPDGCHGTEITNVTGQPNGSILVEGEFFVVEDAFCTQQITYPFHIVKLDAYDAAVEFAMEETTRSNPDDGGSDDGGSEDPGAGDDDPGPGDQGSYDCRKRDGPSSNSAGGSTVSFETLEHGQNSGIEEECLTFAKNKTAWRDLWTAHQSREQDPADRPEVNFSEEIVVAIFKGQSPDGCHGAEIENLTTDGDTLVVHGAFFVLDAAACTEQITYPVHMVTADRHEGPIAFDVENETRQP